MGCHVRTTTEKNERYPGSWAEVSWPYTCPLYPSLQLLAKRLQDNGQAEKYASIIGGKIMTKITCVTIANVVCSGP